MAGQALRNGLTSLLKARFNEPWYYYQGFFGVTIGLERLLKLVVIIDAKNETGEFPESSHVKSFYGHDLLKLLRQVRTVEESLEAGPNFSVEWSLADEALALLTDFAKRGRYHNLDATLNGAGAASEPIGAWFSLIASAERSRNLLSRIDRQAKEWEPNRASFPILMRGVYREDGTIVENPKAAFRASKKANASLGRVRSCVQQSGGIRRRC
ncbi:hypothetical protein ACU686_29715 [Yinghuangia aomiensis]